MIATGFSQLQIKEIKQVAQVQERNGNLLVAMLLSGLFCKTFQDGFPTCLLGFTWHRIQFDFCVRSACEYESS